MSNVDWSTLGMSGILAPVDNKNVPQSLRQRLAMAMLLQKRQYPKTFGEGLSAIGDALGDRAIMRQVMGDAAGAEATAQKARDEIFGGGGGASSLAPTSDVEQPAVAAINRSIRTPAAAAAPPLAAQVQPPPSLVTTPAASQPPAALFNPDNRGPGLNTPQQPPSMLDPRPMAAPPPPPLQNASVEDGGYGPMEAATDRWGRQSAALAGIESGGAKNPYALLGARTGSGDRALGKYQVMAANVPEWTRAATGVASTPQQFLANPQLQEITARDRFTGYADKYGPVGAAKAWYAGEGGMNNPNATDVHGRLTVAGYGQDFANRGGADGDPRAGIAAAMTAQQAPPAPAPDQRLAFNGNGSQPPVPSGLRAAPPAAPIQAAPPSPQQAPQAGPGPGYVLTLPPEPKPPPTMTDGMRRIQQKIWATPPAERESVEAALKPLYEDEQRKLAQQHTVYQDEMKSRHEMKKLQEEQRQKAAKDEADVAHTRAQTAAGKIIQMEGRAFRVQDDGSLKDITPGQTGDGPPQIKMTQDQSDTLKFYKMGKTAASQLEGKERLLAEGWADELAGKVPFAGNKLMSAQYRAAKNAAGLLVQADLRDTSGATIGTQEFKDRFALLIPRPGDGSLDIKNKAEARKAVLEGQRLALGPARPMADYVDKEHAKEQAEKVAKIEREMAGKDKAKTYEKDGVIRRWNGSFWEEH
jgi:hypothetical protein